MLIIDSADIAMKCSYPICDILAISLHATKYKAQRAQQYTPGVLVASLALHGSIGPNRLQRWLRRGPDCLSDSPNGSAKFTGLRSIRIFVRRSDIHMHTHIPHTI